MLVALALTSVAFAAPKKQPAAKPSQVMVQAFDPVTSFQAVVTRGTEQKEWIVVRQSSKNGKWAKRYYYLGDVKYDVKKTDSLVAPVVGLLSFPVKVRFSPQFDTEDEASTSIGVFVPLSLSYSIEGRYSISQSAWKLDQFRYQDTDPESPLRGREYSMDEARLMAESQAIISSVLLRFLPNTSTRLGEQ